MGKRKVATTAEIDALGARTVKLGDKEIALFRLTDGEVLALENRCPHKGGKLSEGMVCGGTVHCPLHDWRIDLRTGSALEPDEGCTGVYGVEVDPASGAVYLLEE
ncbi:nitrite reductase small subunit NirD [Cohnella caldifontis]|uniref:nitrite reductase small subunit NirD n=1 Tax=Cohnella caldifontis TaxID=3027471 RepID=UPI0023EC85D2|nr:nitrite reductase small subunit NirD [Cohnella sp. YIM B05605]